MKQGDKVRCIDAKEPGIPITEGHEYTLKCNPYTYRNPEVDRGKVKAVELVEVRGVYMETRFEVVS